MPGTRAGEEDFDAFLQAQWTPLVRLAYAITNDLGRAEDAVQEAFTRLWPRGGACGTRPRRPICARSW